MPTYKESADRVAAQAETALLRLWQQTEAGVLSRDEFDLTAEIIVGTAADRSGHLADAALASRLTELRGELTEPLGLAPDPPDMTDLTDVTAGSVAAVAVLGVLARSAVHAAGQDVWSRGIQDHGVPGWRRVNSGGGCKPCTELAVAEFIAAQVSMWRHKGCDCHPDPVVDDPQEVLSGPVL